MTDQQEDPPAEGQGEGEEAGDAPEEVQYLSLLLKLFSEDGSVGGQRCLEWLIYISVFIGAYAILCKVWRLLKCIGRQCFRPCFQSKTRIFDEYGGKDSWALVTGGSDGIGLEMCHQLAQQGFNIIIMARNEKKMQEKIEEIKSACSRPVECKYIIADFSKLLRIEQYRTLLDAELANLDVGLVIANAGWGEPGPFADMSDDDVQGTIVINALHVAYLFKVTGEKLMKRDKKSAMIVTSSVASVLPLPGMLTYSTTKRFVSHLSQGLNFEFEGKIDVLSFNPAQVATKLIKKDPSQVGGDIISVQKATKVCFRDLGHLDLTYGAFSHEMTANMISILPRCAFNKMYAEMKRLSSDPKAKEQLEAEYQKARQTRLAKEGKLNTKDNQVTDAKDNNFTLQQ